jgi:beta-fructofuranosidase
MVVGSELPEQAGGAALLYESDDLESWRYLGVLATGETARTGFDFECPDFFPLNPPDGPERHVLLTSRGQTWWQTGPYAAAAGRFTPERWGPADSPAFYAAKTLVDGSGRRILLGWLRERRPPEEQVAAGWSGVLALPRRLSLLPDGSLAQAPAPEVEALRGRHVRLPGARVEGDGERLLDLGGVSGESCEVLVRLAPPPPGVAAVGLRVRRRPDGGGATAAVYDRAARRFGRVPFSLAAGEALELRVFVDRSVVEAFANDRAPHAARTYPAQADARGISVFARGAPVAIESVDVWALA